MQVFFSLKDQSTSGRNIGVLALAAINEEGDVFNLALIETNAKAGDAVGQEVFDVLSDPEIFQAIIAKTRFILR